MLLTVLTVVVALGLGLVGVGLLKPELVNNLLATATGTPSSAPAPEPAPGPVLAALTDVAAPTAAALKRELDPLIDGGALRGQLSVSVVDVTTGQALYERDPAKMVIPASNAKLVTAAAVLAARGPDHRITTRVVAGANPGEVVLIGSGDVTLSINATGFYAGAARLDELAAQVKKALGAAKPTKVIIDGSLFPGPLLGPGWDPASPREGNVSKITALMVNGARTNVKDRVMPFDRYTDPERAAADAFAKLLGLPASAVAKGQAPADAPTATASPGASTNGAATPVVPGQQLGAVQSAPLLRQVEDMLTESDNTLAEALARQVALAKGQPASFEGAAAAIEQVVTELGLPAGLSDLADGSGFSTQNRLSPSLLTGLLTLAADGKHAHLADLFNGLPLAGWSGTMLERFVKSKAGIGVVRAKSGTLDHVNSISGVVQTADGRLLAFAVIANDVQIDRYPAQEALDKIVAKLATCGCR